MSDEGWARAELAEEEHAVALMRESIAVYHSWHEQRDGKTWWQRMSDAQAAMRAFIDRVAPAPSTRETGE